MHKEGFSDLASEKIQTRSYPNEVISWARQVHSYLYDDTITKVDAGVKNIPEFLLSATARMSESTTKGK